VEDLLRLKRVERPAPEFWAKFERELRQKQLAALVERRSWWHGLAATFSRLGWLRLPVGATAVLAITFVSVRNYYSAANDRDGRPAVVTGAEPASVAKTSAVSAESKPAEYVRIVASRQPAMSGEQAAPKSSEAGIPASEALRTAPQQIAELVQQVTGLDNGTRSSGFEALAGSLAIQLGPSGDGDPALVEATARPAGFEDRSISTLRPYRAVEALPTAVAATEQRRSRLLASLGSAGNYAPEPSAPEHAKRSVIRYLAEDGWDRSMGRLQAEADHLSIRF
jgi:hypothetical protein